MKPWWIWPAVAALGVPAGVGAALVAHQFDDDPAPKKFNDNETVWLRMVAGDNEPIDGPIRQDVTNLWTACIDGDHYSIMLGPMFDADQWIAPSVAEDYENWCPGGVSTNHDPFAQEEDS